jgi:hypothetical protein
MLAVTWLVIMYRAETSVAYTAWSIHCPEPSPVFAPEVTVLVPGVCF